MVQELIIQRSSSILIKYLQELSPNWAIIAKIGNWKLETQNWKSKNPKIQKIMRNKFGNFTNLLKISWFFTCWSKVIRSFVLSSLLDFGFLSSFESKYEILFYYFENQMQLLSTFHLTTHSSSLSFPSGFEVKEGRPEEVLKWPSFRVACCEFLVWCPVPAFSLPEFL